MFTIFWINGEQNQVVGNLQSIIAVANLLENIKVEFKVSDRSGEISQRYLGMGSFNYWLDENIDFGGKNG